MYTISYGRRIKKGLAVFAVLIMAVSMNLFGDVPKFFKGVVNCLENPTPTHDETKVEFVKLVKIKEIEAEINDEHFMVRPWDIEIDNAGNIFAFDRMVMQIFKFDKNYKFQAAFGQTGQGPSEFGKRNSVEGMYFSKDGNLCVSDRVNRKIITFDTDGKHVGDFKLPTYAYLDGGFLPIVNPNGDYYLLTGTHCTLDVYNINDRSGKKCYSLFNKADCEQSVLLKVRNQDYLFWCALTMENTFYDLLPDGRLIVYLANTSTVYTYKGETLVEKFNIHPQQAIEVYKKRIAKRVKKLRKGDTLVLWMFSRFFVDKDDRNFFYLQGWGEDEEKKFLFYKFDVKGKLVKIFYTSFPLWFAAKRNNLFYGTFKDNIYILQEEKNEEKSH